MAHAHGWALADDDVARLDALRLTAYAQAPTYYSSAGCPGGFGEVAHATASACRGERGGGRAWSADAVMWC